MKRLLIVSVLMAVVATACAGDVTPATTTTPTATTTTSVPEVNTTTRPETTTTSGISVQFPDIEIPIDAACALDDVPDTGEATVLVGDRLYGLGADGLTPRCLIGGILTTDLDWGPQGDRIRVGDEVFTAAASSQLPDASSYVWTAPTGSRVLLVGTDRLWKVSVDDQSEIDITFLAENDTAAYHPAGENVLVIGTTSEGQYGLWLATNQGADELLLAFDELATMYEPTWTWLGEPMFIAKHIDGPWHIHRVELTPEGGLDGPIVLETDQSIDMLMPARYDPIMLAYRLDGRQGDQCVEGAHVGVNGIDVPEPVASMTSTPVGWLSTERLLLLTYPDGCGAPADLWSFSAGFCPGSTYGVTPIISGVDYAAARETAPPPPRPPDFTGIIDPGPA